MKMLARNSKVPSGMENLMVKTVSFTTKKGAENTLVALRGEKNMGLGFCMKKMGSRFMRVNFWRIR